MFAAESNDTDITSTSILNLAELIVSAQKESNDKEIIFKNDETKYIVQEGQALEVKPLAYDELQKLAYFLRAATNSN